MDPRPERAAINLEIDTGIKKRAQAVLSANGMTLSGAIKMMVRVGIQQQRMPFEVTREPEAAGIGMRDEKAQAWDIPKDGTDGRNGGICGVSIRMDPEEKKAMRQWCKSLCITPNALAHLYLGQIAFELRVPLNN